MDAANRWDEYRSAVGDERNRIRNEIATAYFDWATRRAELLANEMGVVDRDNAVGEVLLRFVDRVIPHYDGRIPFENYAGVCIRRLMIDQARKQRHPMQALDIVEAEVMFERAESHQFEAMIARVPHTQAVILWLRFSRGLTIKETAKTLGVTTSCVRSRTSAAMRRLRFSEKDSV